MQQVLINSSKIYKSDFTNNGFRFRRLFMESSSILSYYNKN